MHVYVIISPRSLSECSVLLSTVSKTLSPLRILKSKKALLGFPEEQQANDSRR